MLCAEITTRAEIGRKRIFNEIRAVAYCAYRGASVPDQLKGWNNIAKYMGQSKATVQHWAKSGLPVSREGRSVVASTEELSRWLARESGRKGAQIVTDETDLSAMLQHGLKDAHANRKSAKRDQKGSTPEPQPPSPKIQVPPYSPVLPLSQIQSRISGLEKRVQQLSEFLKSVDAKERRKINSEIRAINSAIGHYQSALAIEQSLENQPERK
jgi:hypothetical protein